MENASKALLMAGGILLGLIIISVGVLLYSNMNRQSKEYSTMSDAVKIRTYNAKLEKIRGRNDITPQEIISIYNYIEENRSKVPLQTVLDVRNDRNYPTNRYIY